jgi:hypothetical protein
MSKPLSLRKAAARLNIPPSTFAAIVRSGKGPRHIRIGNVYRFDVGDLDQYRDVHTIEGAQ